MDGRRLTVIVIPHGESETRAYELRYRTLKIMGVVAGVLAIALVVLISSWWFLAAQAARVPGLERDVARLEEERAKVAELARTLEEVEEQYERVRRLLGGDAGIDGGEPLLPPLRQESARPRSAGVEMSLPASWPLTEPAYVTRELTSGRAEHPGVDIAVQQDSYVRAAGSGTVVEAGEDEVYGRYVVLDHGEGVQSVYGHASKLFVEAGEPVERHQVIALTGSTGQSTAPHLHFEIRRNGSPVDPWEFVKRP